LFQLKDLKLKESNRLGKEKGSSETKDSREKEFYAGLFSGQKQAEQERNLVVLYNTYISRSKYSYSYNLVGVDCGAASAVPTATTAAATATGQQQRSEQHEPGLSTHGRLR